MMGLFFSHKLVLVSVNTFVDPTKSIEQIFLMRPILISYVLAMRMSAGQIDTLVPYRSEFIIS